MATKAVTSTSYRQLLADTPTDQLIMLDFWATWCGPCRMFSPIFERVSEEYPDVVFGTVDTDAEIELAQQFGIVSIPTVVGVKNGEMVFAHSGAMAGAAFSSLVKDLKD